MKVRTCPVCGGDRIIIILRHGRKGLCYDCGTRWEETALGESKIMSAEGQVIRGPAAPAG